MAHIPGRLERLAQKLAVTVVVSELFDTLLRIVTCDASRKTHFVIPTSMPRQRLAKEHPAWASERVSDSENAYNL